MGRLHGEPRMILLLFCGFLGALCGWAVCKGYDA